MLKSELKSNRIVSAPILLSATVSCLFIFSNKTELFKNYPEWTRSSWDRDWAETPNWRSSSTSCCSSSTQTKCLLSLTGLVYPYQGWTKSYGWEKVSLSPLHGHILPFLLLLPYSPEIREREKENKVHVGQRGRYSHPKIFVQSRSSTLFPLTSNNHADCSRWVFLMKTRSFHVWKFTKWVFIDKDLSYFSRTVCGFSRKTSRCCPDSNPRFSRPISWNFLGSARPRSASMTSSKFGWEDFVTFFFQNKKNSGSRRDSKTGCATERQNRSGGFRQKGARHSGRPGRRRLVDFCENLKYSRKNDICFQHILWVTESEAIGSPRRVGGQGDTTAGSLGLLLYWARK